MWDEISHLLFLFSPESLFRHRHVFVLQLFLRSLSLLPIVISGAELYLMFSSIRSYMHPFSYLASFSCSLFRLWQLAYMLSRFSVTTTLNSPNVSACGDVTDMTFLPTELEYFSFIFRSSNVSVVLPLAFKFNQLFKTCLITFSTLYRCLNTFVVNFLVSFWFSQGIELELIFYEVCHYSLFLKMWFSWNAANFV